MLQKLKVLDYQDSIIGGKFHIIKPCFMQKLKLLYEMTFRTYFLKQVYMK